MFSFETLLIVLVLGFCAYASYIDLRHQKIPNICSFGLLYVGILYQGIAFYKGTLPLGTVLINILVGGVLVVALYWFGVIAPGDAKLLWGASLALPITLFQQDGSILFPSLVVCIECFCRLPLTRSFLPSLKNLLEPENTGTSSHLHLKRLIRKSSTVSGFFRLCISLFVGFALFLRVRSSTGGRIPATCTHFDRFSTLWQNDGPDTSRKFPVFSVDSYRCCSHVLGSLLFSV